MNFKNWINGGPQKLAKTRVCKVDYFILPLFLVPKLSSVAQNGWKKHPYIFFLLLVQKKTSLRGKNWKKNEKIPKT